MTANGISTERGGQAVLTQDHVFRSHHLSYRSRYWAYYGKLITSFSTSTPQPLSKMQWKALALALLLERSASQGVPAPANIPPMLRFQCSHLVIERLDPLVSPGSIPSPHLHQIVGGNSFNATMDSATHDLVKQSTCTSCTFTEDLSNYWTAVLYFRARNGTYKRVRQLPNIGLGGNGGITVYYIPPHNVSVNVTAFKPGFRMLVGDAASHKPGQDPKVCHRCMPKSGDNSNLNCASPDTQTLPKAPCVGGIRSVITFPTCWDGVNTDTPDHKSHVAYPISGNQDSAPDGGVCPSTHPVKVPQVMLETIWDVSICRHPLVSSIADPAADHTLFRPRSVARGRLAAFCLEHQRQVSRDPRAPTKLDLLSRGSCRDGYTQHGDYVFGWKDNSLQRAMDARCTGDVCSVLENQTFEESIKCTLQQTVKDDVDGCE